MSLDFNFHWATQRSHCLLGAGQSKSFSDLEKDLDDLLQLGAEKREATACREAPIYDGYLDFDDDSKPFLGGHQGLMITSMPHGCFVY